MAYKVLEGKYRAKVLPFTFKKIDVGDKEVPLMEANLQPIGQVVDGEVKVEEGLPKQNFGYFLDLSIQEKGKYAGKSGVEATKIQMAEVYEYTGPFNMEKINSLVPGREVDIVCEKKEKDGKAFTKVKYVNNTNGKGGTRKPVKHLSEDEIAAFDKVWTGATANQAPAQDAKSLFAQLTGGADAPK